MTEEIEDKKKLITTDATANAVQVIKAAILQSQQRALKAINQEQLALYYGIGRYVSANTRKKNWGKGALATISEQLRKWEGLKKGQIMKKVLMTLMAFVLAITANAQSYNVGTSSTTTDYMGNQTTTHRDRYGNRTGTSTSSTDYLGNTTTTHRDSYGNTIGTSTTSTDYMGNTTTVHRDRYGNRTGTDRSNTDYMGNTHTTYSDSYGNSRGSSTTSTDYLGNTTTNYKDQYGNSRGTSTSSTDYLGNRNTQQRSNDSNTTIWSW